MNLGQLHKQKAVKLPSYRLFIEYIMKCVRRNHTTTFRHPLSTIRGLEVGRGRIPTLEIPRHHPKLYASTSLWRTAVE